MKIVTKEELLEMPDGTVFMLYEPHYFHDQIHIKTGKYIDGDGKPRWNGEASLSPGTDINECDFKLHGKMVTDFSTVDTADIDYDDDQLFGILSKPELIQMVHWLMWALKDGNYDFKDVVITETEDGVTVTEDD